jgi:hypothetical protein
MGSTKETVNKSAGRRSAAHADDDDLSSLNFCTASGEIKNLTTSASFRRF